MNGRKWSKEEIDILKELSQSCYINEVAKALDRTEAATITKARRLDLDYITLRKKWTNDEIIYIKGNWGALSISDIARNLNTTRIMVQRQANYLSLPKLGQRVKWTKEAIDSLRESSQSKSIKVLARKYKTTETAIISVAHKNNIKLKDGKIKWTEEDKKNLEKHSDTMTAPEISVLMRRPVEGVRTQAKRQGLKLKNASNCWKVSDTNLLIKMIKEGKTIVEMETTLSRTSDTIYKNAKKIGINIIEEDKRWTEEEEKELVSLSKTKTTVELVSILNRSTTSIQKKAKSLKVKLKGGINYWSEEEQELVKKIVEDENKTTKEVAELIGRTEYSVILKLNRMGIKFKNRTKKKWTEEEIETLSEMWGDYSYERMSKVLGRSVSSIKNKVFTLELGPMMESNYDGLTVTEICDLFETRRETVTISWVSLGLKIKTRKISKKTSYKIVEIDDLFKFLEKNQNIWDSRNLEKHILGLEPEWLKQKRKTDFQTRKVSDRLLLTKQQLLLSQKFFLKLEEFKEKQQDNTGNQLIKNMAKNRSHDKS